MNEKLLRQRLRKTTIVVVVICVTLLVGGSIVAGFLQRSLNEVTREQLEAEAREYRSRIYKQIDADFQTVTTLAHFIEPALAGDQERFAELLDRANQSNSFLTMAYFGVDSNGILSTLGEGTETGFQLSALAEEAKEVVEKAWRGEQSVSRLYESTLTSERVFAYGVPVYDGETVIGALCASDHIEIFSDILKGDTVLNGNGYIHLVGSEGDFLIRSSEAVVRENLQSIFEGPYFDEEEEDDVRAALQAGQSYYSAFTYRGRSYQALLEPLGTNGWYLLCVNSLQQTSGTTYHVVQVLQVTFAGVALLAVFLMLYGYRLLRRNNRELIQLAYSDPLTGANNMARFLQKLPEALEKHPGCVAVLNIRHFTFFTEIFGRAQANRLLCHMKEVFEHHLRDGEFLCRDTSDWFYLFLQETSPAEIRRRLEAMMSEVTETAESSRGNYQLVIYCGVSISEEGAAPERAATMLMNQIQFALQKSRGPHHNNIWFYDAELHKTEELENYIESHMHQALRDREFKLFLQPQVDLKTGRLVGAEALVRWITGSGLVIYPDQFIPLFEQNGFCVELDFYMLESVCRQLREWMDQGLAVVPVSVNQSKLMFYEADYVDRLSRLMEKYRLPPGIITLEILEYLALENVEELNQQVERLREKGFRVAMDDFGSGYSSLNTLGRLKIDELKLDRGFLKDMDQDDNLQIRLIIEQVVRISHQMKITTVVEGVETAGQANLMREMGCDYAQGYYYSRPVDAESFRTCFLEGEGVRPEPLAAAERETP